MWMRALMSQTVRQFAEDQIRRLLEDGETSSSVLSGMMQTTPPTSEQLSAPVALVFGHRAEAGGWLDRLAGVRWWPTEGGRLIRGKAQNVETSTWVAGEQGLSPEFFDRWLEMVSPRLVICAGSGVALDPTLRRGALVLGTEFLTSAERLTSPWPLQMQEQPRAGLFHRCILGGMETPEPGESRVSRYETLGASVFDPDGQVVIQRCAARDVPWLVVRIVTEPSDEVPPATIQVVLDQESLASKVGAAVGSVWNEPKSAAALWEVQERALAAGDRLAKFLCDLVVSIDDATPS